jgi:hypothetical protein
VFVALNHGELPVRARLGGELAERVRRAEDYAALGARVVVKLHTESHAAKPSTRAWAITRRAQGSDRRQADRQQRGDRHRAGRADRTDRSHQPERGWLPMTADPIHPDQLGGAARFRADLVAYLDSLPVDQLADLLSKLPNRQQPLGLGVLMVALNERLPDAYKLRPPAGQPGRARGGAARCGSWSPTARSPAPRQPSGIVTGRPGARPRARGRLRDSWRAYRERAEHIRQTYGWPVPQPPPRAEPWLPLGRYDDQEHDQPPYRSWRWLGEERDREDR